MSGARDPNEVKAMATTKTKAPDVLIANEGTLLTFCPLSSRAKRWIEENVHSDAYQWFGNVLVVEHRFAWGLAAGMNDAGLVLQ
jgi:hypothetical protein